MSRQLEMGFVLVLVGIVAIWGAVASKLVKEGAWWGWYYVAGMAGIATWTWMAKRSPWTLVTSALLWDVVYNLCWMGTAIFVLHQASSKGQIVGAVLVLVGLVCTYF